MEADRALAVGAMEYVPDDQLERVLRESAVHPWTVVQQGADKWRACHDYSVGTNRVVPSAPFGLPTVWDVRTEFGPPRTLRSMTCATVSMQCPSTPTAGIVW